MHRAEYQRGGGAVAQELVAKDARGLARHCLVGEGLLGDEGVGFEPLEQLTALRADDAGLHVVDMRVDEPRCDQAARMIGQGRVRRQRGFHRRVGPDRVDHAVAADHEAVRLADERGARVSDKRIVPAEDQGSAQRADRALAGRDAHWSLAVSSSMQCPHGQFPETA